VAPVRVDTDHFSPDVREFIAILAHHRVDYMIVGGQAVILHGHARLTGDVDFFFRSDQENRSRLFTALREFWKGEVPGLSSAAELAPEGVVVQFGVPPNRIDLINSVDGVSFDDAWSRREEALLRLADKELPVPYIGIHALIRNKEAAGRPKDLDDLAYLRRAAEGSST
jgi:hypothetical protein